MRGLRGGVVGQIFTRIDTYWPRTIATETPDKFSAQLVGQAVRRLDRRGKYIVFTLTRDSMLVHLKMTGRLYVVSAPAPSAKEDRWVRIAFQMSNGQELRFSDARKFGRVYLVANAEDVVGKLGPEPLSRSFSVETFQNRLATRKGAIKQLLLNQNFVAGIGNIYADEALWLSRIDPRRKADTLRQSEIAALFEAIRTVLKKGIAFEGASINWYRKPDGSPGESQNHLNVYGRENQPCLNHCNTMITKIWLGQRGTHFCPSCQK